MITLTGKQREAFDFIAGYVASHNGVAPTYDEIKDAIGLVSKSGVNRLVVGLEERGYLRRIPARARCIEILHTDRSAETILHGLVKALSVGDRAAINRFYDLAIETFPYFSSRPSVPTDLSAKAGTAHPHPSAVPAANSRADGGLNIVTKHHDIRSGQ